MKNTREVRIYGNLDTVIAELLDYKRRNEDVYCVFNGHVLKALDLTVDSAYLEVTGFTKEEYDRRVKEARRKWEEEEKKEAEEAIRRIPEWIEKGKRVISPDLHEKWVDCVHTRVSDLYHGADLDSVLDLLEMLNAGVSIDSVLEQLNKQGHSGFSESMVTRMVYTFSNRRNEFFRAITKMKEVEPLGTLDDTIGYLIALRKQGIKVFCDFNGNLLFSEDITRDGAYKQVTGYTKAEWEEKRRKWNEDYEREEAETRKREQGYKEKVEKQRGPDGHKITKEKVVAGLKFIAENRFLNHDELVQGLIDLGCTFTLDDVKEQFPEDVLLFEGMARGDLGCGASVICNVRDSAYGRSFADDRFLSVDDGSSVYHFIRVVTGDESYTMDSISQGGPKF